MPNAYLSDKDKDDTYLWNDEDEEGDGDHRITERVWGTEDADFIDRRPQPYGYDDISALGGDDTIYSGIGWNTIDAGAGNDVVWSGGEDHAYGGDGDDILRSYSQGKRFIDQGSVSLSGGRGSDVIITRYDDFGPDGEGRMLDHHSFAAGGGGGDYMQLEAYNDQGWLSTLSVELVAFGDGGNDLSEADDGNDVIVISAGNGIPPRDRVAAAVGEGGDDFIVVAAPQGWLAQINGDGGPNDRGNDQIYSFDSTDIIHGGRGNDTIMAGAGDDEISTGPGYRLRHEESFDLVYSGSGADLTIFDGDSDIFLADWDLGDHVGVRWGREFAPEVLRPYQCSVTDLGGGYSRVAWMDDAHNIGEAIVAGSLTEADVFLLGG